MQFSRGEFERLERDTTGKQDDAYVVTMLCSIVAI